jgi:hypothetical protein
MCFRLPIDAYNDGEVSFSITSSIKRRLFSSAIGDEFSDDENDDENVTNDDASNVKTSIIGKLFNSILIIFLFPLVLIYRLCAKSVSFVFKVFSSFTNFVSRKWRSAKRDYNSFMSTNDVGVSTERRQEHFTVDEDDVQVPKTNEVTFFKKFSIFFQRIFNSLFSFSIFSKSTTTATNVTEEKEDGTWIEVFIIRRIVCIYR